MMTSACKSCGASIVWVTTPSGKNMPLDATPTTMWLVEPDGAMNGSPKARPVQVRVSHFSTCPQAAEHRRSR